MTRQQRTARPKQKFSKPCMDCGQMPTKSVINGVLVTKCECGTHTKEGR